jgi:VanZ family protein
VATDFFRYHLPAILWAAVILVLTLLPAESLPPTPTWELLSFDTFCHAAVFALLAFLVIRSFQFHYGSPRFFKFALLVSLALCLFFGILIEMLQTIMKRGRHGEVTDVLSDFIGELLGALFFYVLLRRKLVF